MAGCRRQGTICLQSHQCLTPRPRAAPPVPPLATAVERMLAYTELEQEAPTAALGGPPPPPGAPPPPSSNAPFMPVFAQHCCHLHVDLLLLVCTAPCPRLTQANAALADKHTHTHTHTHAPGTHHAGWPGAGRIDYRSVSAIYRPGLPPVLRDLTFTLEVRCLSFVLVLCLLGGVDWVFLVCVCVCLCAWTVRASARSVLCPARPLGGGSSATSYLPRLRSSLLPGRRQLRRGGPHRFRQELPHANALPPHPPHKRHHTAG